MDDLKMLGDLGRHLDEEPPAALVRQRQRLVEAAQGRPSRRRLAGFGRSRPVLGLAVLGTAVAIGIPAVLMSGWGEVTRPLTGGPTVNVAKSAPSILSDTAPRPDQFLFVETRQQYEACNLAKPVCRLDPASMRRVWLSVDGTRDGRIDQKVAGMPMSATVPGCRNGVRTQIVPEKKDRSSGRKIKVTEHCTPDPVDRSRLPGDAEGMRKHLYGQSDGGRSRAELMFKAAGDVVRESYVPAKVRKALFTATRRIPGVTLNPKAVDPAGRHGVGLRFTSPYDGIRTEYFFDPKNYQYLGVREVTTKALPDMGKRKGEVFGSAAVWRMVAVDRVGQVPG
ncbi:CU044_5270 family protein [Actinomadura sp. HBU206391]|uniref:CU044_5270 family protein n=1 Tax=Actinomadura sp. HBU206391 TaxID=2731692 RepID=UPI001650113E|nr:CU044_5270 family protein [Actinomadura sp. HBU206391]MBC6460556.1 CU044_5270 family protein [Actinomadura sp. HBU206391]